VRGYVVDVYFCVFDVSVEELAVTAKIANNPELAKALTDPNLTPTQKQQLAKELVSGVMVELGYTQAVDVSSP
jgi:F0F1-type ATP synthase delta subunit